MSSRPNAFFVSANRCSMSFVFATSAWTAIAFPPSFAISLTTWSAASFDEAKLTTTDAATTARYFAILAPILFDAPVTTATFPASLLLAIFLFLSTGLRHCGWIGWQLSRHRNLQVISSNGHVIGDHISPPGHPWSRFVAIPDRCYKVRVMDQIGTSHIATADLLICGFTLFLIVFLQKSPANSVWARVLASISGGAIF